MVLTHFLEKPLWLAGRAAGGRPGPGALGLGQAWVGRSDLEVHTAHQLSKLALSTLRVLPLKAERNDERATHRAPNIRADG